MCGERQRSKCVERFSEKKKPVMSPCGVLLLCFPVLFSFLVRDRLALSHPAVNPSICLLDSQLMQLYRCCFQAVAIAFSLPICGNWRYFLSLLYSSCSVVCGISNPAKIGLSDLIKKKPKN